MRAAERASAASPSLKNCHWMLAAVAPSALRTPISRVRSRTAISMMFITPMPPSSSVTTLTARKNWCMPPIILPNITVCERGVPEAESPPVLGTKSWRGASRMRRTSVLDRAARIQAHEADVPRARSAPRSGVGHAPVRRRDDGGQASRRCSNPSGSGKSFRAASYGMNSRWLSSPGVVRVLLLLPDAADHGVGQAVERDLAADRVAVGEQLLRLASKPMTTTRRASSAVLLVEQPPAVHLDRPDVLVDGPDAAHLQRAGVEGALHLEAAAHQLRADVLEQRRRAPPASARRRWSSRTTRPARVPPACRLVRPFRMMTMFLPSSSRTFWLPRWKPSPSADRTHDRDHAPHDPEHRQEAAQLVGPQVRPGLAEEFHITWQVTTWQLSILFPCSFAN